MRFDDILVAVPTRGEIQWATVDRLQAIRDRSPGLRPIWWSPCHLGVTENQNLIADRFLYEGDANILVLVEEDVVPSLSMLDVLVNELRHDSTIGVTFQPYLMALRPFWDNRRAAIPGEDGSRDSYGLAYCVFEECDGEPVVGDVALRIAERATGWQDVYAVGTGCIAIHRRALEKLPDDRFKFERDHGEYVGNDVKFCHSVREEGFRVRVFWDEVADHMPRTSLEAVYAQSTKGGPSRRTKP